MNATKTVLESSHVIMLSHPKEVCLPFVSDDVGICLSLCRFAAKVRSSSLPAFIVLARGSQMSNQHL
jgi:hypothetical protein